MVKRSPAACVDVLLQRRGALRELARQPAKHLAVDRDAALFHARQHRHQRPFQPLVDGDQPVGDEPRLQHMPEAKRDVGALGGVGGGALDVDEVERDEVLAGADDVLERDHRVAEPALGERGDVVRAGAGAEHVGDQHRVVEGGDVDAVAVHRQPVVFEIVADLEDRAVGEQRLQRGQCLVDRHLVVDAAAAQEVVRAGAVADRDVGRLSGPDGQREADRLGPHRVERGRLGAEGDDAGLARLGDPCLELGAMADAGIALVVDLGAGGGLRPRAGKRLPAY